jgi:hypothetical protein
VVAVVAVAMEAELVVDPAAVAPEATTEVIMHKTAKRILAAVVAAQVRQEMAAQESLN